VRCKNSKDLYIKQSEQIVTISLYINVNIGALPSPRERGGGEG